MSTFSIERTDSIDFEPVEQAVAAKQVPAFIALLRISHNMLANPAQKAVGVFAVGKQGRIIPDIRFVDGLQHRQSCSVHALHAFKAMSKI